MSNAVVSSYTHTHTRVHILPQNHIKHPKLHPQHPESSTPIPSRIHCSRYSNSKLSLTHFLTRFLNSGVLSRHNDAASTFAGDSSFGLESMDITESRMVSGVCTGDQRSEADS